MNDLLTFLGQDWVGSAIGLIGVALAIFGVVSYQRSRTRPRPAYQRSALRLLGKQEDNLPGDVSVSFNGTEVERLTRTTLILWNSGTDVLRGEDIVEADPLTVSFPEGTRILSFKILKKSKEVNRFEVHPLSADNNSLRLTLDYLDPGDGITLEILHDSEKRYPKVQGSIKGVPKGFEDLGRVFDQLPTPAPYPFNLVFKRRKPFLMLALGLGISAIAFGLIPQEYRDQVMSSDGDSKGLREGTFFLIFGSIYAALPTILLWLTRKRYPKQLEPENGDDNATNEP